MTKSSGNREKGQTVIVFAVTLPVMLSMLALVLDVGWGYYIQKKAQTAADAAALAAVAQAAQQLGPATSIQCGSLACQAAVACPGAGNLQTACQYAAANGFSQGGDGGNQTVLISAGANGSAPGVPNVTADYWVQVTAQNRLQKWFSGLAANAGLAPVARATAALRNVNFTTSLDLLNRSSDCFVSALNIGLVCGEDFLALGGNTINTRGGIQMASSNATGLGLPAISAGTALGVTNVAAPFTYLMGNGGISTIIGGTGWSNSPINGFPDGDYFTDPMAGKGQPPVPTGLSDHPVPGGVIVGSLNPSAPTVLPPGNYYSTLPLLTHVATGLPVTMTGNVIFGDGQNPPCGGFCNYVFYGGMVAGSLGNVTVSPGRYVIAGAQPVAGGPGLGITVGATGTFQDLTPLVNGAAAQNTDAGEIFIFTDMNYPGLQLPVDLQSAGISLPQARAGILTGLEPVITLHGLNKNSPYLPSELSRFAPVVLWQDQANTTVKYQSNGKLDFSCGGICSNLLSVPGTQQMVITASQVNGHAGTNLYGTVYSPRGSWLTILGLLPGDTVAGPLQIITGALQMTLNSKLDLQVLPTPPTRMVTGLIQ